MTLLIAGLVAVMVFVVGFLVGKAGKDELSKQNAAGIVFATSEVNSIRKNARRTEDALDIAVGTLKDITRGLPAPELAASSALNSIQALDYKE